MEPVSLTVALALGKTALGKAALAKAALLTKAALAHPVAATISHQAATAIHTATTVYHGATGTWVTAHSAPLFNQLARVAIGTAHTQGLAAAAKATGEMLVFFGAAVGIAQAADGLIEGLRTGNLRRAVASGTRLGIGGYGFGHIELPPSY